MKVPFVDLKSQYQSIKPEIDNAIKNVVENTAFIGGSFVEKFEKEFAAFCNCKYAVGVNSGTSALGFTLLGLGIGIKGEKFVYPTVLLAWGIIIYIVWFR